MPSTINLTGLTTAQIQQLQTLADQFRTANERCQPQAKTPTDLSFLCFRSEILQPFDRSQLYGSRA